MKIFFVAVLAFLFGGIALGESDDVERRIDQILEEGFDLEDDLPYGFREPVLYEINVSKHLRLERRRRFGSLGRAWDRAYALGNPSTLSGHYLKFLATFLMQTDQSGEWIEDLDLSFGGNLRGFRLGAMRDRGDSRDAESFIGFVPGLADGPTLLVTTGLFVNSIHLLGKIAFEIKKSCRECNIVFFDPIGVGMASTPKSPDAYEFSWAMESLLFFLTSIGIAPDQSPTLFIGQSYGYYTSIDFLVNAKRYQKLGFIHSIPKRTAHMMYGTNPEQPGLLISKPFLGRDEKNESLLTSILGHRSVLFDGSKDAFRAAMLTAGIGAPWELLTYWAKQYYEGDGFPILSGPARGQSTRKRDLAFAVGHLFAQADVRDKVKFGPTGIEYQNGYKHLGKLIEDERNLAVADSSRHSFRFFGGTRDPATPPGYNRIYIGDLINAGFDARGIAIPKGSHVDMRNASGPMRDEGLRLLEQFL